MASPLALASWPVLVLSLVMTISATRVEAATAFFVFSDSLVDNGNNNYLATTARADSPPYGIDTPSRRPTGRFSNGKNIPDFISDALCSEPTLPYLSPQLQGNRLLVGANFASAGIGILNDTGIQFINIIRMYQQLQYFQQYQNRLADHVGMDEAQRIVSEALVLITVGGNNFVNNYFLVPFSGRSQQFSLPDYVRNLISEYRKILMRLYELGARKVLVTSTGPMGCVPAELAMRSSNGECAAELQRAAGLIYYIEDSLLRPRTLQWCGIMYGGIKLEEYAFWDAFHPTEKANGIIVDMILNGSPTYITPINLTTLFALDTVIRA
ncbi:hypothetical protein V6N11_034939 [Hibiscus sabdariffa]|uniref:Uncharacterized protein n=2 Tax=Hibiscus sabdariffa TaxID=183260 RepID=A0ABR2BIA2_9ROSI